MALLRPGDVLAGHRIEGEAGRGGMGVVYRATNLRLKRIVALKVIAPWLAAEPGFHERFEREMELAAALEHPHVIPVYEAGDGPDGELFVTMRFIDGTDMRALMARTGRLDPGLAADLIDQVASALDAAHRKGLVHRDVKPANVLISYSEGKPHAYLTDFGLTKRISSESGLTLAGTVVGTVDYIAPEQVKGEPVDGRADVYALGCVLFQALTGVIPYPRDTDAAKMYAHASAPVPSVLEEAPELPPQLAEVVRLAMAKHPEDRYQSAGELGRAALAAVRETGTAPTLVRAPAAADRTPVAPGGGRRPPAGGRRRWLAAGAAAAIALLVAVVLVSSSGGSSNPPPTQSTTVRATEPTPGLLRPQLDAKVNAACRAYKRATDAVPYPSDYLINATSAGAYLDKIYPSTRAEYLAIAELKPDSSVKTDFDKYLQNGTYRLGLLEDERGKAHLGDLPGLRRDFQALTTNLATITKPLKRKLGFTACF
jgi:Protein kinase domain